MSGPDQQVMQVDGGVKQGQDSSEGQSPVAWVLGHPVSFDSCALLVVDLAFSKGHPGCGGLGQGREAALSYLHVR